MTHSRPKHCM